MPTYAYACKDCGHAFDIVQSFSDSTLTDVPRMRGHAAQEVQQRWRRLQGLGFYRTDSRDAKGSTVSAAPRLRAARRSCTRPGGCRQLTPARPASTPGLPARRRP